MLGKRVVTAVILIPVVLGAVYLGGPWFLALLALVALLAGYEFLQMTRHLCLPPTGLAALGLIVLFLADGQWPALNLASWGVGLIALATLALQVLMHNVPGSLAGWALAIAGGIYIGFPVGSMLRLRAAPGGTSLILLVLLGTWVADTGAYFVGSAIGRHKLAPAISPKKTWEGLLGGLAAGVITVALLGAWLLNMAWPLGVLLGVLLVAAATLGDLAESVIKRQVNVKDSGTLIPGHGGMLDRIDSLLFVVPLVYYWMLLW